MPIYSYRCESCEHTQDVLQKISDLPLVVCPSCGASAFRKQVTAAGFQLKGSGWYATDFRNPPATKGDAKSKPEKEAGATDTASSDEKAVQSSEPSVKEKAPSTATSDASSSGSDKSSASPPPSSAPGSSPTPAGT